MDALITFGDNSFHTKQTCSLCGPVTGRTRSVFLTRNHDQLCSGLLIFHRGVIDTHLFARRNMFGVAALGTRYHFITDTDIGECSARHNAVITTAGAVGVKVFRTDLTFNQILPRRMLCAERPRRRDMVGCDRVTQNSQWACALDIVQIVRLHAHPFEEWRVLNICRAVLPVIGFTGCRAADGLPFLRAFKHVGIAGFKHFRRQRFTDQFLNFRVGRPDIFHEDIIAVFILPQWLFEQIHFHRTCKRVGNNQWRRCQIVRLDVLRNTAFEVTVTR